MQMDHIAKGKTVPETILSDEVRQIIANLRSRSVTMSISELAGATHIKFCCYARFSDGRDPLCTYGATPDEAVFAVCGANRDEWSDLGG